MSIATCGHEVFEGISCSLKLSKDEWSFGTYCVDCLKLHYQDDTLEDNEAKKLCIEIEKLQKENEQMKKVLTELRYGIFHHSHVSKLAEECFAKLGKR